MAIRSLTLGRFFQHLPLNVRSLKLPEVVGAHGQEQRAESREKHNQRFQEFSFHDLR